MRVLQVHARYRGRGGEDTTVESDGELLRNAGHEVYLHEERNAPDAAGAIRQLARSPWNTAAARRLGRAIDRFSPDLVHVHNTWFALSPAVVATAHRRGLPVVMTIQNYRLVCVSANLFRDGALCEDCVGSGPWAGVRHRCYRDSAAASGVLATSIVAHRRLRTWKRFVDVYVAVSRFGVERHVAGGVPRERIVVKDNYALDPGPRPSPPSAGNEVLFVGRSGPEKGLETLLRNWEEAAPDGLTLRVIGDVDQSARSLGGSVEFSGPLDHGAVRDAMARARALAIPSEWPEGQPLVLLEALAAGLPVVGSAIGGIDEVLRDCEHAARVPVGDKMGWVRALRGLADPEAVDRGGAESRRLYERRFDPAGGIRQLTAVYRAAIERRDSDPNRATTVQGDTSIR